MSRSNDRFGRRAAQDDKARAEPRLSFTPRGENRDTEPALGRKPTKPARPRFEDSQPQVADADRPLYLYIPPDEKRGHAAFGWITLAVLAVIAAGGGYAWHVYTAPPALDSGVAPETGYTTPPSADQGTPPDLAPGQPLSTAGQAARSPASAPPANPSPPAPATQAIATPPTPKSLPSEPPPPPRKTISEAASEAAGRPPAPPPERAAHDLATAVPAPAKHEAAKTAPVHPSTERKDASLELPKPHVAPAAPPAPATATPAPVANLPPPVAAPSTPYVPQSFSGPAATGAPLPLSGSSTPAPQTSLAAPVLHPPPQAPASSATAATAATAPTPDATQGGGPNTVTIDGVTYINGEQPHALGTLSSPTPPSDANVPPLPDVSVPATPQPLSAMPYTPPANSNSAAPLPNDVIIQPNGQMTVPSGQQ